MAVTSPDADQLERLRPRVLRADDDVPGAVDRGHGLRRFRPRVIRDPDGVVEGIDTEGGVGLSEREDEAAARHTPGQQEIDALWGRLAEGGGMQQCGWVTDKFGVTWQVVPAALQAMLTDSDPARSQRVMQALLQMGKLDLAVLTQAYNQE